MFKLVSSAHHVHIQQCRNFNIFTSIYKFMYLL